ncbi:MAG: hypothetical protein KGR26_15195, partial [Cyanobacteria bacterium REEB65]|nr:hypothetical protein [Cyanobacteria bacterium REEB65]
MNAAAIASLQAQRRVALAAGPQRALVAAERLAMVRLALPWVAFESDPPRLLAAGEAWPGDREGAIDAIVRGWIECSGPLTIADLQSRTLLAAGDITLSLARLEAAGIHLRGQFTPGRGEPEVCDRRILARIHRATVRRLRREIEPAPSSAYLRFLADWQHASPRTRLKGVEGVLAVVEQLAGFEAPANAWESDLLALRVSDYSPALLDRLALGGEVVWGRFSRRDPASMPPLRSGLGPAGVRSLPQAAELSGASRRAGLKRTVPLSLGLRQDLPWLLAPEPPADPGLSSLARRVLTELQERGARFASELAAGLGGLESELDDALGQLVAGGLVTSDGFSALRQLTVTKTERSAAQSRWLRHRRFRPTTGGRW